MAAKKRILHVDDHPSVRMAVRLNLSEEFELTQCSSLSEAKSFFRENEYDLVILDGDIHVRDDGRDLARHLHKSGQKVLLLTGGAPDPIVPTMTKSTFNILERVQDLLSASA
jgi:DNA-binding response OmpR family regulator